MNKKVAIRHSSLNVLGGGEFVAVTIIDELRKSGYDVVLYSIFPPDKNKIWEIYQISLDEIPIKSLFGQSSLNIYKLIKSVFIADLILAKKMSYIKDFDLIIDTSNNGYYPIINKNSAVLCYVHFPMYPLDSEKKFLKIKPIVLIKNLLDRCYTHYDGIISNSEFTSGYLKTEFSVNSSVIYPPVKLHYSLSDFDSIYSLKEDILCSVGRISPEKKFHVIIKFFKKIYKKNPNYKLIIAGTIYNEKYYSYIQNLAKDYPIFIYSNLPREDLVDLLKKSKFYLHAKGFGEEKQRYFEHFGISTVEAMNCGCIPIVINKGGQKEIVDDGINGFCWNDLVELEEIFLNTLPSKNLESIAKKAVEKSLIYGEANFREKFMKFMRDIDRK